MINGIKNSKILDCLLNEVNIGTHNTLIKFTLWGGLISFFSLLMFNVIWPYTSWEWDVDFLQSKYLIIHLDYYRLSFYAHIFSSLIVMFSGAFLFSKYILQNYSRFHRFFGKLYVGLVLLISAPTGMVMAFHANGGWPAKISFLILTPLWWWFTYKGYQTARSKNFTAHKKWMMRSYALTLSAITLRLCQLFIHEIISLDPTTQYVLVSWGSWMFNLGVVEVYLGFKVSRFKKKRINTAERKIVFYRTTTSN